MGINCIYARSAGTFRGVLLYVFRAKHEEYKHFTAFSREARNSLGRFTAWRDTGDKKEQLLRESKLFVLPTYYRYEGTPRSVREALSYGMPVIATEWSGLPDMVTNEENGFLVPVRSPQDIAEAIIKSVSSSSVYCRLSQGALASSQRGLSLEGHLECMKKSFALALSSRR